MGNVQECYSAPVAARLVGISDRQILYWAITDLAIPSVFRAVGKGHPHLYSFTDLTILRAIKRLKDGGVSLQALRKVSARLRDCDGAAFQNLYLTSDGKRDVLLRSGDDLISMLRQPGQIVFAWILSMADVETEVRQAVAQLAKAA